MAFSDETEFPRGIFFQAGLGITAVDIAADLSGVTAGDKIRVSGIQIHWLADCPAGATLSFRATDNSPVYFVLKKAAPQSCAENISLPGFSFYARDGLEVVASRSPAVDITILAFNIVFD